MPHKESRYLIPVVPFIALLAVSELRRVLSPFATGGEVRPVWLPVALIAALALGTLHDIGHWRLPRSNGDVRLAADLSAAHPAQTYAIEQAWRMGGRLYFPARTAIVDLDPNALADPGHIWRSTPRDAWIALDAGTAAAHGYASLLSARGYREVAVPSGPRYRVWRPANDDGVRLKPDTTDIERRPSG
jgi:hypothetical protein